MFPRGEEQQNPGCSFLVHLWVKPQRWEAAEGDNKKQGQSSRAVKQTYCISRGAGFLCRLVPGSRGNTRKGESEEAMLEMQLLSGVGRAQSRAEMTDVRVLRDGVLGPP